MATWWLLLRDAQRGIKALRDRLSEYVRLAADGEIVLICDHDVVVAELRAARPARAERVADAVLADLVRRGLATPALLPSDEVPQPGRGGSLKELLTELTGDRGDR